MADPDGKSWKTVGNMARGDMGSTTVTIMGSQYTIRGDADPEYIREIARFVDERMRQIAALSPAVPPLKVAILAALNVADDLYKEREGKHREESLTRERLLSLAASLDQVLPPPDEIPPPRDK
jgi:cell division protein ZapA